MSAADTWMPLYVSDFLADTTHLSATETGGYLLLLMGAWNRGGILPNDDAQLGRICRSTPTEWAALKPALMPFFEVTPTHWIQHRLLKEKDKANHRCQVRAQVGKLGGRPKSETNSYTNRFTEKKLTGGTTTTTVRTHTEGRPSREEVVSRAQIIGLADWKALDWFDEMEGCGWIDYNHRPVDNWQSILNRVRTKWEADGRPMAPPSNSKNGSKTLPLWQQIKILEEEISLHPANRQSVASASNPTELQLSDYRRKKEKLSELKKSGISNA